jgi:hypothetical protein
VWTLLAAWPLALLVGWGARRIAHRLVTRRLEAPLVMTGNAAADVVLLQTADRLGEARAMVGRWEWAGAALPLAGLSFLSPLTIHLAVWTLFSGWFAEPVHWSVASFGEWMSISAYLVGHAHLALALCSVWWARSLSRRPTRRIRLDLTWAWFRALAITVLVACIPGALLFGIPPLLVAFTGLLFVPAMYLGTIRTMTIERLALGSID